MGEIYALVSAGGAPGVTTTGLALTLAWPAAAILAECDPSGGDVLAGLLAGHVPASRGLVEHAIEAGRSRDTAAADLGNLLVPLDDSQRRFLLPGLTDPRQAAGLTTAWPAVAATFAARPEVIIADCGRLDAGPGQPQAVLASARLVAVVLRPTLRQVWAARARLSMLSAMTDAGRIVLLITGPGTHPVRDVSRALATPVAAVLPADPRAATLLSDGIGRQRHVSASSLLRSARSASQALQSAGAQSAVSVPVPAGAP